MLPGRAGKIVAGILATGVGQYESARLGGAPFLHTPLQGSQLIVQEYARNYC
jgi:hypothetical protein